MFSVVTPTYNRADLLARSLEAMRAMLGAERCEFIVVDDGSTDHTPAVLESMAATWPGRLRHVRQENAGPGVARNTGLELAGSERILFLDDDVFPRPDLLTAHAALLDMGFALSQGLLEWHPEIAGDWVMRYMDKHGMQFAFDRVTDDSELSYLYVYTANLAVTRAAVEAAGGFDHAFAVQRYAFEDTAFGYCAKRAGCRLGLNRAAVASHLHPITAEGLVRREYKVGYAVGVLRQHYPQIARELGLDKSPPWRDALTRVTQMILDAKPLSGLLGRELRLRLACRAAFGKGMMNYESK